MKLVLESLARVRPVWDLHAQPPFLEGPWVCLLVCARVCVCAWLVWMGMPIGLADTRHSAAPAQGM